jgi:hypothetical protein
MEPNLGRTTAAIIIASVITPLLIVFMMLAVGSGTLRGVFVYVLLFAIPLVLWLIASWLLRRHRRDSVSVSPQAWLRTGALIAFLHPAIAVSIVQYGFPVLGFPHAPSAFPAVQLVIGGLWQIPLGVLAGGIFWKIAIRPGTESWENPCERLWSSVSRRRLVPMLSLLAPLPGVMLIVTAINMTPGPARPIPFSPMIVLTCALSLLIAILGGFLLLHVMSAGSDRVSRAGCLLAGGGTAFLTPVAVLLVGSTLARQVPVLGDIAGDLLSAAPSRNCAFLALSGVLMLPFGLPGGWLIWRLAIAPAKAPPSARQRAAAVFD